MPDPSGSAAPRSWESCLYTLTHEGFAFIPGDSIADMLGRERVLRDWAPFSDSWNRLEPDIYLRAVGRERQRRHAVFAAGRTGPLTLQPPQPHYQALQHNPLQGDIQRWFAPLERDTAASDALRTIIQFGRAIFSRLMPDVGQWRIETHQFRIQPRSDAPADPTPEGPHRDGVDGVLVVLIDRVNVAHGETTILHPDGGACGSFTLAQRLDTAIVDDRRLLHGVTAVELLDPSQPGFRDVLVVTYLGVRPSGLA